MTVFVHSVVIICFKFLFIDCLCPTGTLRFFLATVFRWPAVRRFPHSVFIKFSFIYMLRLECFSRQGCEYCSVQLSFIRLENFSCDFFYQFQTIIPSSMYSDMYSIEVHQRSHTPCKLRFNYQERNIFLVPRSHFSRRLCLENIHCKNLSLARISISWTAFCMRLCPFRTGKDHFLLVRPPFMKASGVSGH